MGRENNDIGKRGELLAADFLKRKGYEILGANIRTPFGELDLVAKQGAVIVFVETKTRVTDSLGPPFLSVTREKAARIVRNALFYLKRHGKADACWRIDVVSVKLNTSLEAEHIEVIENAVESDSY